MLHYSLKNKNFRYVCVRLLFFLIVQYQYSVCKRVNEFIKFNRFDCLSSARTTGYSVLTSPPHQLSGLYIALINIDLMSYQTAFLHRLQCTREISPIHGGNPRQPQHPQGPPLMSQYQTPQHSVTPMPTSKCHVSSDYMLHLEQSQQ